MMKKLVSYSLSKVRSEIEVVKVRSSKDAEVFTRQLWGDDLGIFESFFLLTLNRANSVTGYVKISQGGCFGCIVDPVVIAKYAIDSLCSGVILVHNHPSGALNPSDADMQITKKIKEGLSLFNIQVLDHLILTEESYYSFSDNGVL